MKTRLTPKFAQLVSDAVARHLARRQQGVRLTGEGNVSEISLAVRDELRDRCASLMLHRLPSVGPYKSMQLVDDHEIEGLILAEFAEETAYGVNLLDATGGGGVILHFEERQPAINAGRVAIVAWGWFEMLVLRLETVLSNAMLCEEEEG